jgi:hypothetical protein
MSLTKPLTKEQLNDVLALVIASGATLKDIEAVETYFSMDGVVSSFVDNKEIVKRLVQMVKHIVSDEDNLKLFTKLISEYMSKKNPEWRYYARIWEPLDLNDD